MLLPVQWFVGIDWASQTHEVCILDRDGRVCARKRVAHTADALQALITELLERASGDPTKVAVGIEVPRGSVVELLVERGFPVYAVSPKQVDRFRDRFTAAGAKDDSRDAWVIADSLRTDAQAFRRVRVDSPVMMQLREWSRLDDDLGVELSRLANRLRDVVYRIAPEVLALCPAADEAWFWTLLRQAPTPNAQRRLTTRRVERLLQHHRIRRLDAAQVRTVLQQPRVSTVPGVEEAGVAHMQLLLPRLELVAAQRRDAARHLDRLLLMLEHEERPAGDQREHADVAIVRSMPGIGTRVAARMLAEASQPLVDRAYHVLRALMGVAPVTKRSGRRRTVMMRYACNHRLRDAAYHWARTGMLRDPVSRAYYVALRTRGHSHGRAMRTVADRLLRVLCVLLRRDQLFNPAWNQVAPPVGAVPA